MENLRFTINKQKNKFYERGIKVSQFERQNFKDEKMYSFLCCTFFTLTKSPQENNNNTGKRTSFLKRKENF